VDKAVSGMSGGGDMTLTTQQTTSTISPPQTPPRTLQQRCSQLHNSLMNCTMQELQNLSSQLSLNTANCNTELDYINLIEKFSRNSVADASNDDIKCKDDNDNDIQSTPPINIDNQQEQIDVEHMNDHNTSDIIPQDNDYRSHLQTQLHTTLQSLSLIELQSLATRLSIDYSNCLHDKVDENFIQKGVIQDGSEGDTSSDERKENAIIEKLARQHVMQLIEEKALNLPIVLECGNNTNTTATDDDGMNDDNDDETSVISAITTYTSLVNSAEHTKQNSKHTANVDNTEPSFKEDTKSNHDKLSNNYREYLQSIRNGGYESYEGNNGSDNNVVRLLSHKEEEEEEEEEEDEVQNVNEGQGAVDYSEISKEEQVIHHPIVQPRDIGNNTVDQRGVNGVAVQMTSQYPIPPPPPPPPPRRKLNQTVVANDGVIPKEQQHFHLPPPPPPPPRRNEVKSPIIKSPAIDNKFSPEKPTISDSKAEPISQTDIDETNEISQEADNELDNEKQEEFLDAMSELAEHINATLQGIAPTAGSSQSNNNKQEEFDIDSLIPKNPSQNRSSSEESMVKEQYKEYLYPDDESLNDSSYKLHMKQVVKDTSTDTKKSNRHRVRSRRSKKSSRKQNSEVLSSVCESTTELDTSSASSASDSDDSEQCESDDDKLTKQTSQLVANLQDYITNI